MAIFSLVGLAVLGVVCITPLWPQIGIGDGTQGLLLGLAFWIALDLIGSAAVVRIHTGNSIDAGTATLMAATVLGGPLAGALVGFFGSFQARELRGNIPVYGVFANHLSTALPAAISGLAMGSLGLRDANFSQALLIGLVGVFTQMLLNKICATFFFWCRKSGNAIPEMVETVPTDLSTGFIGNVMGQMCLRAGIWTVLLFAPLLLLVREAMISAQLSLSNTSLEEAVRTDPLTGLGNRLRLNEDLIVLTASLSRSGRRAALVILDLDHFKLVNDLSGHLVGDEALRGVAAALRAGSRLSDRLYRFGGEEFLVLTEDSDASGVAVLASRLVETVAAAGIPHPGNAPYDVVTISAGFALIEPGGSETADQALRTADAALFEAKAAGRNRVCGLAA